MPIMKKRGYFFMLDATLALFVLVIGVFLVLSFMLEAPPPTQVGLIASDIMNFLSSTKIKELNNPYAGIGGELWKQGTITDQENTLLQQAGGFYYMGKTDLAEKFLQNVSELIVPQEYVYEIWIDNSRVYPKNPDSSHITSKDKTNLLLTSQKLTFGIVNKTTSEIFGPYKAEVYAWQR
jgi:hypothetical protein